ncbi:hypothetical protein FJZ31_26105 [Candidatus Poribacteria bacterium]|nr:hypothetical protein [Candidatus Poribacteria bacterium]
MFVMYTSLYCMLSAVTEEIGTVRPFIKASDVVFMYPAEDPSQYDAYSGTVVGWAGRPRTRDVQDVESFRKRVEEGHRRGMRYCGSDDFLVDFRGFIDFRSDTFMDATCRDLDGNPIRVPWLWDHEYKGHKAYWWCTNNPDYQAYLRDQAERACMAPIDGLHIDDYSGTSACSAYNGGCFCRYCMEGFREHLRQRFSPEQLSEMGIERLNEFDYREFLKAKGVTAEQCKKARHECPLGEVFQDFQNSRMKHTVREIFEYAEQLRGKLLLRSVNSSASSPRALLPAPLIDFFCGEVPHNAASAQVPTEPAFVFRLVEALKRRQTATASGHDWAWIKANEKPGLVRTWMAQTYALGSVFMVPHRQWCYTPELGTHWWHGRPEDFAYIYRFVREHASLLDSYISLAKTALIYTNANFSEVRDAALKLTEANIPYVIIVVDDEDLSMRLTAETIAPYEYIIVGTKPLSDEQEEILKRSEAKVIQWKGLSALPNAINIAVEGSDRVRVSVRYNPDDSNGPIVCHLLNQNYEKEKDDVYPVDVRVALNKDLVAKAIENSDIHTAVIHLPKREPVRLPVVKTGDSISFEVKDLGLWAIVELRRES